MSVLSKKKNIKEILINYNFLTESDYNKYYEESKKENKNLILYLCEKKLINDIKYLKILSDEWGYKPVDLSKLEPPAEVLTIIPEIVSRRHICIAFGKKDNTVYLAMSDPRDFMVVEDIALRTGYSVQPYLSLPHWIMRLIELAYGVQSAAKVTQIVEEITQKAEESEISKIETVQKKDITDIDPSAPEVEKIVNGIFLGAISQKASDIHIEPFEDPSGKNSKVMVRYRVDGVLKLAPFNIPWSFRNAIIAKVKIMTNSMNITERRIPQSGRIQIMAKGSPIEFRVEVIPTVYGESCVMRILDRKAVQVDIKKLAFLDDTLEKFLKLLEGIGGKKNFGLVLVCGPTGSGKSTTLYAALNYVNRPDIKILTAENPVEYNLDGIVQVPVNPDIKLGEDKKFDFALALRSFLRLDPDVIMVGEIRDRETAEIAMEAAMTGHLVFSTIHTNDAPSSVSRLVEMGIPSYIVASTLKAVLAQRLSRRLCDECKEPYDPKPEEIEIFKANNVEIPEGSKFYAPKGCKSCNNSGFKGRLGLHELLVMEDNIREFMLKDYASDPLKKFAVSVGMRPLICDGLLKVIKGWTTVREVIGGTGGK
ncbi:MAG TPA: ATPase, T2SS/T4P/T4SS family [Elusimicrobiales bacterium]|nr:ATPase, T2SS/T4P/T4SS family [Elusimicrobiales bacterium]HPO95432.1 ATPase, T2SS/T4P/T4SS family [Elusimicrobiales bacterium]